MPYTYILFSEKFNKYYVGSCVNIERRLYEHNIVHSKFTSLGILWKLVLKQEFVMELEARRSEQYIKKMKSRRFIELLIEEVGK